MPRVPVLTLVFLLLLIAGCAGDSGSGGADGGGGSNEPTASPYDDLPPGMTRAKGRALRRGMPRSKVFARFGKSEFSEGGPAVANVLADRCYTYRVPGTEEPGKAEDFADGETVYDSWWICFADGKLVHKEGPDGDKTTLG